MKKTGRVNIRVSGYVEELLERLMELEGKNKSRVIEEAIETEAVIYLGSGKVKEIWSKHMDAAFEEKKIPPDQII